MVVRDHMREFVRGVGRRVLSVMTMVRDLSGILVGY